MEGNGAACRITSCNDAHGLSVSFEVNLEHVIRCRIAAATLVFAVAKHGEEGGLYSESSFFDCENLPANVLSAHPG